MTTNSPRAVLVAACLALAAAPGALRAQAPAITLLGYSASTPSGWVTRKATSSMRLAEFAVGRAGSADSAEVVVYFFGPGQGGTADANLARWKGQFSNPTGEPVFERVTRDSTPVAALTIAEYQGTYARGMGAGSAPDAARPNNTLLAVVMPTPRGTLFFQLFGTHANVDAARAGFLAFVRSIR